MLSLTLQTAQAADEIRRRKHSADLAFLNQGITFTVYGREEGTERIFPYNGRSAGTAFRRACRELGIKNLHFHDLRHEAASRFFEAGFSIEQVALVTGHKDWKMLRRYTNLRPEDLHVTRKNQCARLRVVKRNQ